jgi:hypothetical protein
MWQTVKQFHNIWHITIIFFKMLICLVLVYLTRIGIASTVQNKMVEELVSKLKAWCDLQLTTVAMETNH